MNKVPNQNLRARTASQVQPKKKLQGISPEITKTVKTLYKNNPKELVVSRLPCFNKGAKLHIPAVPKVLKTSPDNPNFDGKRKGNAEIPVINPNYILKSTSENFGGNKISEPIQDLYRPTEAGKHNEKKNVEEVKEKKIGSPEMRNVEKELEKLKKDINDREEIIRINFDILEKAEAKVEEQAFKIESYEVYIQQLYEYIHQLQQYSQSLIPIPKASFEIQTSIKLS